MNAVKNLTLNFVIWSVQASSLALLISAGAILGLWAAINALALIV